MSLALVQDYPSEEEQQQDVLSGSSASHESVQTDEDTSFAGPETTHEESLLTNSTDAAVSSLPSADLIFSEVTGPPEYLKDSIVDVVSGHARHHPPFKGQSKESKTSQDSTTPKELPDGAMVHAKAQYRGSHDRVRNDTTKEAGPSEDTAKRLGVCVQCSVPKTYSSARGGLVCPVCKDKPHIEDLNKRRGSKIKERERSKRMKGQSTHATWKSETEMQLRQQFD